MPDVAAPDFNEDVRAFDGIDPDVKAVSSFKEQHPDKNNLFQVGDFLRSLRIRGRRQGYGCSSDHPGRIKRTPSPWRECQSMPRIHI